MRTPLVALLLLCLLPGAVMAEQRYITDELSLDLRREPGNQYRILRMLPAGTPVTVLDSRDGWSQVRVDDLEGWVVSRMLSQQPAARDRLAAMQQRLGQVERESSLLQQEKQELRTQHQILRSENERLVAALEGLQQRFDAMLASADEPVRLMEANRQLSEQLEALEHRHERQVLENAVLRTTVQRDWLIAGGGVLGAGLLLGLILPSLVRRRQRRLSSDWM